MDRAENKLAERYTQQYRSGMWTSQEKIAEWLKDGFEKVENSTLYCKTTASPMYSSQVKVESIGKEPDYGQSVHEHRYYTFYYRVSKSDYAAMLVKPELTEQYRPYRYHNYDGFVECDQQEKRGLGWREVESNYHTTTNYVYFVE